MTLPWQGVAGAPTSTQPLQFGRYFNYPTALNGQLDDVSLWNRALTQSEIYDLMAVSPTGTEAALEGLWRFDEGSETTTADSTGHSHQGTLLNGPIWVNSTAPIYR